jgi:hypothetical protein
MDLITDLPKSGKYDAILTIVDQGCSKAAKFLPCNKTIDGEGIATLYLRHLLPLFGTPKRIISDRDPRFTGHFTKAVCKATGIKQNLSTAFHPRTDGQSERMNLWIETYLRNFINGRQNNWSELLPIAEYAHNSWRHEKTRHSPHQLLIGINPTVHLESSESPSPSADHRLKELRLAREKAQSALMKQSKNPRKLRNLDIGQQVWLDARNLKVLTASRKLSPRRYGPFPIKQKISEVAYRISLPPSMKIHDVFHVDLLTPYAETSAYGKPYLRPPPETIDGEEEYEVEDILMHRKTGRNQKLQYLVKWKGYPSSENSWVNDKDLHAPEILERYKRSPEA